MVVPGEKIPKSHKYYCILAANVLWLHHKEKGEISMSKEYLRVSSFYVGNRIVTESTHITKETYDNLDKKGYVIAGYQHVANLWLNKKNGMIIQIIPLAH